MPRQLLARVALTTLALIMILLLSALFDLANARATRELLDHLGAVVAVRLLESSEFDTHTNRVIRELQTYVLTGEEDELDEAADGLAAARQDLAALDALETRAPQLADLAATHAGLNERRRNLLDQLSASAELVVAGEATAADLFAEVEQIEREVEATALLSQAALAEERARVDALAAAIVGQNRLVIAVGIGAPLFFSLLVLVFLHHKVVRPIRELAAATRAFAEGRLREPVGVSNSDEIGVLQRSFNSLFATIDRQTAELIEQANVADDIRAQALAARQLVDELAERNQQILAQSMALEAEISERRLAEEALIQARDAAQMASRAKSAFLATMSHELRTPLTAILGFSQLLAHMAEAGDYSRVRDDLNYVRAAGNHLLALINDLLDLSRIEAGQLAVVTTRFDVGGLVQAVATMTRPLVERGGNRFIVSCPPELGTMFSDELKVRQALLNLVGNAAKFTEGGRVALSVEAAEGDGARLLRFVVADTGIGIPGGQLPSLFQTFSQLDDSPSRKYGGTGLGLALSQRLAQALGGRITVASEHGIGSTFTLELPAEYVAAPRDNGELAVAGRELANLARADDDPDVIPSEVYDTLVLSIDDDPAVGSLLKRLLRSANAAVVHAPSGQAGLELAHDLLPDLILLDVLMPDLDGWEVLTRLKSDPELSAIPVVLLTVDDRRQIGLAMGASEYLVKPFEPQQLIETVRRYSGQLLASDGGEPMLVLLVEQDPLVAAELRRALEAEGWSVARAAGSAEALAAVAAQPPDVLILELLLPDGDGMQLLETLRCEPPLAGLPTIVLVDRELDAEARGRLSDSVTAILEQGRYELDELISRVRQLVARPPGAASGRHKEHHYG